MLGVYIFESRKIAVVIVVVRDELLVSEDLVSPASISVTHQYVYFWKLGDFGRRCCSSAQTNVGEEAAYELLLVQVLLLEQGYIVEKIPDHIGTSTPSNLLVSIPTAVREGMQRVLAMST